MTTATSTDSCDITAVLADLETRLTIVERERDELRHQRDEYLRERDEYRRLCEFLREENARLRRGLIGHRPHRMPEGCEDQLSLAMMGLLLGQTPAPDGEQQQQDVAGHTRRVPVRKPFPEHLPRISIDLVPAEVEKEGLDAFDEIGSERREVIERRPASVVVVEVVRRKFVRRAERDSLRSEVLIAPVPELPIVRGTAGPGLIADTIVRRWQDHQPLARMETGYRRDGIELSRSTLCTWHTQLATGPVGCLVEAMHADALLSPYVCTDATGVLVQHPGRCHRGHFWVLVAPKRHVLFRFSMKHDGEAVDGLLRDYRGYVVADAHKVYDHIYGPGKATEAGCWSHMRQYVLEALLVEAEPAREAMNCIQALFAVERSIAGAPPQLRRQVREQKSRPALEWFFAWCDLHRQRALEGSPLADAIRYATNQKDALMRFLEDGRLPIHNNVSERELRRQAVGRKNWMFLGSEDGAKANTVFVSLLASCAMHGIEPWAYLRDLLCLLPSWPQRRLLELAPVNWATTHEDPEVQERLAANIFRRATLIGPGQLPVRQQAAA